MPPTDPLRNRFYQLVMLNGPPYLCASRIALASILSTGVEARRNADQAGRFAKPFHGLLPDGLERPEHLLCRFAVEPCEWLRPARLLKHGP